MSLLVVFFTLEICFMGFLVKHIILFQERLIAPLKKNRNLGYHFIFL